MGTEVFRELAEQAIGAAGEGDVVLRLYLTPGREGEGRPTALAMVSTIPAVLEERRATGMRMITVPLGLDPNLRAEAPWLLGGVKSTSYAVNMAAEAEARRRGADDAVFLAAGRIVLEGPVTNIWWRQGRELFTPELDLGILAGVTRSTLLEQAAALGYDVREGTYPVDELAAAEEAFTSSSVREVMPVIELDGAPIGRRSAGAGRGRAPGRAPSRGGRVSAQLHTAAERPDLWERAYEQIVGVWPTYNEQGDVLGRALVDGSTRTSADYQFVLYDEERDVALAHGHSIPCRWDGTVEGLPATASTTMMEGAVHLFDEGGEPNTLSALAIEIPPTPPGRRARADDDRRHGDIASARGFGSLIAPLRPTWKVRYPVTPIERYAAWTRGTGCPSTRGSASTSASAPRS